MPRQHKEEPHSPGNGPRALTRCQLHTHQIIQPANTRDGPHQEKHEEEVVEVRARSTQRVGDDAHARMEGKHLRRCNGRGLGLGLQLSQAVWYAALKQIDSEDGDIVE